jgi:hypothetical protein
MILVYTVTKIEVSCKLNNLLTSLGRRVTREMHGIRDKNQPILRIIMGNADNAIGSVF